jgi:hypothetical protein
MGFTVPNRLHHDQRVPSVEAAGDICDIDHREEFEIGTASPVAILYVVHVNYVDLANTGRG